MKKTNGDWHFFTCPSCGGHHFGTARIGERIQGRCHDEFGVGCRWTWDRADDLKYGFKEDDEED